MPFLLSSLLGSVECSMGILHFMGCILRGERSFLGSFSLSPTGLYTCSRLPGICDGHTLRQQLLGLLYRKQNKKFSLYVLSHCLLKHCIGYVNVIYLKKLPTCYFLYMLKFCRFCCCVFSMHYVLELSGESTEIGVIESCDLPCG